SAGVKPARAILRTEDTFPVEISGLCLSNRRMPAIRTSGGWAHAEASFGKVKPVAHGAPYAVVGNPTKQRRIDSALQHHVFDQPADGIVGQRRGYRRSQTEAAPQTARHVVFS